MCISDWSSDVCSSDLRCSHVRTDARMGSSIDAEGELRTGRSGARAGAFRLRGRRLSEPGKAGRVCRVPRDAAGDSARFRAHRSEEHTSELQSLMRISYAVFCLKKKHK